MRGRSVRDLAAAAVVLFVAAGGLALAWITTGSAPSVVGWWLAVVGLGVLLPGWALVGCLRGSGPSVTDLGWSGPAGVVVALLTWLLGHLVGVALPSLVVGPVVAVTLLAVPPTRRRIAGTSLAGTSPPLGRTSWPLGVWVVLAAALLLVVRWMWVGGIASTAPVPTAQFQLYHQDLLYQTALTGEARRSLEPGYPMVAGEPLGYHWFFHALAAQLGGSGLHDLDVVSRLLPATLVVLLTLLAASIGQQVVGHWAGAVGSVVAIALVRPISADPWPQGPLSVLGTYWQLSPTATLGWLLGLALTGSIVAALRRGLPDRQVPVGLLPLFAVGAAGAKSAQVPVIVCGVSLAGLAWLVAGRRRPGWGRTAVTYGALVGALLVVVVLALRFIYPGSYGLRLDLHAWPASSAKQVFGTEDVSAPAVAVACLVTLARRWLPMLLPCAGILVLLRRRPSEPAGWIGLGVVLAGLVAVLTLTHPSASQYYFVAAAFPIGLALSGAGAGLLVHALVTAADGLPGRAGLATRVRSLLVPGGLVVLSAAIVAAWQATHPLADARTPVPPPLGAPRATGALAIAWAWSSATLLVVGVILLGATIAWVAMLRGRDRGGAGAWGGMIVLAFGAAGLVALVPALDVGVNPGPAVSRAPRARVTGQPKVSPALFEAGQYLREHADAGDVVATNRVWNGQTSAGDRDNRDFSVVALSGLRTDVSGYGYAPRMLQASWASDLPYFYAPFWDPERLWDELALVTSPTRATLDAAYDERGIRWIVADERSGPVSPHLAELTDVVMHQDGVWLARLPTPRP